MEDPLESYPLAKCRQGALFQRNPVCALCFRVCLDLSEEYGGGIHFELLQSLEVADSFCERVILNPWELLDIDQYYHWLERQLGHSKPAVTCAFATICVTLTCMDRLPEPVLQLSRDMRGLISGGQGGELYDNLRYAARHNDILIHPDNYGDIPPQPDIKHELEQLKDDYAQAASEIITLKKQLQMKEQQDEQKAVYKFYGPYIKENHVEAGGNQILSAENVYLPGAEKVSIDTASSLSPAPHNSAEIPSSTYPFVNSAKLAELGTCTLAEFESDYRKAAAGGAPKLAKFLKHYSDLQVLDFDDLDKKEIFSPLQAFFPDEIKYGYTNFTIYF